jgi:hypothetical protein
MVNHCIFDIPEVLFKIFSFFDHTDLYRCALVNSSFYNIFQITFTQHPVCQWRRSHYFFIKQNATPSTPSNDNEHQKQTFKVSSVGVELFMNHRTLHLIDMYGFQLKRSSSLLNQFQNNVEFFWSHFHSFADDSSLVNVFVSHTVNTTPTFYVIVALRDCLNFNVIWETDLNFVSNCTQCTQYTQYFRSCLVCRNLSLFSYPLPKYCKDVIIVSQFIQRPHNHLDQVLMWKQFTIFIFFCDSLQTVNIFSISDSKVVDSRILYFFSEVFHHTSTNFQQFDFIFLNHPHSFSISPLGKIHDFRQSLHLNKILKHGYMFTSLVDRFYLYSKSTSLGYYCENLSDGVLLIDLYSPPEFVFDFVFHRTFAVSIANQIIVFNKSEQSIKKMFFNELHFFFRGHTRLSLQNV